ncbi:hypothetical protein J2Z66_005473 [Paenibacillus eucommiae]|uniref:Uncharacterized protein n=1 Tax=Paenibacillus eucommiae TaxID=1355755 RepID=A0ABS4J1X8_9BACL|nr:hypothetical protein [Paenibacillus eucommiae]
MSGIEITGRLQLENVDYVGTAHSAFSGHSAHSRHRVLIVDIVFVSYFDLLLINHI